MYLLHNDDVGRDHVRRQRSGTHLLEVSSSDRFRRWARLHVGHQASLPIWPTDDACDGPLYPGVGMQDILHLSKLNPMPVYLYLTVPAPDDLQRAVCSVSSEIPRPVQAGTRAAAKVVRHKTLSRETR